jgi:siderophore synthetase component
MSVNNCYYASFNVGNIEVCEKSISEIADLISDHNLCNEKYNIKIVKQTLKNFKKGKNFEEKNMGLDFFIIKQPIWESCEQKRNIENATN